VDAPATRPDEGLGTGHSWPGSAGEEWVERARLLLDLELTSAPVIMVTAAGGAGKSTLADQWLRDSNRVTATLRLSPHLDDPAALATALLSVLDRQGPTAAGVRATTTATEPAFSTVLLPTVQQLVSSAPDPFAIVIDDLQFIRDPACHRLLACACDAVPSGSQLMLLSRDTTPSWLARARAQGRLAEFGPSALAFDVEEAALLFDGRGLAVPADQRQRILEHTEGWAVGLYLSALAIRDGHVAGDGAPESVPSGSDRFIADYLSSQILDDTDPDARDFLLRTSILDELTGPLCDALLDRDDSSAMLPALHAANQLVIALDDVGERFRYHHLLGEALRTGLVRHDRGSVADLHRRAARWFDAAGDPDSAIRHAKAAADLRLTGELVLSSIGQCIGTGHPDLLRQRLSGLTDRQLAADPTLALAAAWLALMTGDVDSLGAWLATVEAITGPDWRAGASGDPLAAALAMIHALAAPGSLAEMADLSSAALLGLPRDSAFRPAAAFLHGVALTLTRDLAGGRASLQQAVQLARAIEIPVSEADSLSWLGVIEIVEGNRTAGSRLIMRAAALGREHHLDRLSTGAHSLTAEAFALALQHDLTAAARTLATARRQTVALGYIAPWFAVCGRILQARTAILLGDGATARLLLAEARALMTPDLLDCLAADLLAETETALRGLAVDGVSADALTTAELRVLQFLPSHLTFRQIGERLFLSQNTVKTHALSIYRKLGVSSRDDSVVRARSLGLVDGPSKD
jgi:LuxR family transcriptional regulator, maltose regulon positive regulatory protein